MERAPLKKKNGRGNQSSDFEITNAHWNRIVRYLMTKYQQNFMNFLQPNGTIMLLRMAAYHTVFGFEN